MFRKGRQSKKKALGDTKHKGKGLPQIKGIISGDSLQPRFPTESTTRANPSFVFPMNP